MNKGSIKNALAASLSAEETSFKTRLAKAEAVFGDQASIAQTKAPTSAPTAAPNRKPANADDATASVNGRVMRDSFTMPEKDYALINEVRSRCLNQNLMLNKSEVLRAGLQALSNMTDDQLATLIASLEKVKTGRPAQS